MADELKVHLDMAAQDPAIPDVGPDECPKWPAHAHAAAMTPFLTR